MGTASGMTANAVTTHNTKSATSFARKKVTVYLECTISRVGVTKLLQRERRSFKL